MPIDWFAVCVTHRERGPGVWRCVNADELRWWLVEHGSCDKRIVDEYDPRSEWPSKPVAIPSDGAE
jgi:hypothetical protein